MVGRNPGRKSIFVMVCIIVVTASLDTSITRISVFTSGLDSYEDNIAIFTLMVFVYGLGQFIVLRYANSNMDSKYRHLNIIKRFVTIVQYILLAILVSIILQMVFTLSYSISFLKAVVWINYFISIILLGLLTIRFFLWFKSNRNSVVMAYAAAMVVLCLGSSFTILYVTNELTTTQRGIESVQPRKSLVSTVIEPNRILNSGFLATSILSFILTWIATVLLLRQYSSKLGLIKYWVTVSIPLVFFLSQFQALILNILAPFRVLDPILFGIVFTLAFGVAKTGGGILFGIAFWNIARNVNHVLVKDYLMISAYGLVLLYASNQPLGVTLVPFPPFSLVTISLYGLASYLIYLGVYTSALSVANDSQLRKSIKKTLRTRSDLLSSIGSAQMHRQVEDIVLSTTKKLSTRLTEETGVEPSFLEEDEVRDYINQVMEEIKSGKGDT